MKNGSCKNFKLPDCPEDCTYECCDSYDPEFDGDDIYRIAEMLRRFEKQFDEKIRKTSSFVTMGARRAIGDTINILEYFAERIEE